VLLLAAALLNAAATTSGPGGHGALARNSEAAGVSELRLKLPFNDGWRFKRQAAPGAAVEAEFVGAEKPAYDDSAWETVHLPHTWDATFDNPFAVTGHFRGLGWYRQQFDVPDAWRGHRVHVEFKAVFQVAEVWVNGKAAGRHAGGFTGFTLDITPLVEWGASNLLVVRVNDVLDPAIAPANETNVAAYGGITRTAWLVITPLSHFPSNPVHVETSGAPDEAVTVKVITRLENPSESALERRLETQIEDSEGRVIQTLNQDVTLQPNRIPEIVQTSKPISSPHLWSPDDPYLYRAVSTLYGGDRPVDRVVTPFGIHFMGYDPATGFTLNGKPVNLRGVNRRQDYGFLGDAVPEAVGVKDIQMIKAMGANFMRTAHYPQDPAVLDACDRLGILVWEEIPNIKIHLYPPATDNTEPVYTVRFPRPLMENLKLQLGEMIRRDWNHSSIIIWGLGDDLSDYRYPEDFVELSDAAHQLDHSRWTAARSPHVTDVTDATSEPNLIEAHRLHPERKYIWNEWGSFASQRGTEGRPYFRELPADPLSDVSLPDSEAALLMEGTLMQWNALPWLGTAKWCMFDTGETNAMRTQTLWERPDARVAFRWPFDDYLGVADMWRLPKEGYYLLQGQWTEKPMVHIVGHWEVGGTPLGGSGRSAPRQRDLRTVRVYSNCDAVELFLNKRSLGARRPESPQTEWNDFETNISRYKSPDDFNRRPLPGAALRHPPFVWRDVVYEPGRLLAVCRKADTTVKDEIQTPGGPVRMVLKADQETLAADDADVAFIEADVVDANGVIVPAARPWIRFSVEGPGRLLGGTTEIDAISGVAAINVQSTGAPGIIVVTATAPGVGAGSVRIEAKP
jgi:beta-galactosidase